MRVGREEGAFAAFGEHGGVDVRDCYGGGGGVVDVCCVVEEAEGNVAGTAGDVEHCPAFRWGRGGRRFGGGCAGVDGADKVVSG